MCGLECNRNGVTKMLGTTNSTSSSPPTATAMGTAITSKCPTIHTPFFNVVRGDSMASFFQYHADHMSVFPRVTVMSRARTCQSHADEGTTVITISFIPRRVERQNIEHVLATNTRNGLSPSTATDGNDLSRLDCCNAGVPHDTLQTATSRKHTCFAGSPSNRNAYRNLFH